MPSWTGPVDGPERARQGAVMNAVHYSPCGRSGKDMRSQLIQAGQPQHAKGAINLGG